MTQPSIIFKRMIFHTKYQKENESLSDFATSLKTLLRACQYEADFMFLDGLARDRFIAGIADKELQAFLTTQPASIHICRHTSVLTGWWDGCHKDIHTNGLSG